MTLLQLIAKYESQLASVNPVLTAEGLPPFYQGFRALNPDYTLENTPRVIFRWWPPGGALDQLYLRHTPTGRVVNVHGIASGRPYLA